MKKAYKNLLEVLSYAVEKHPDQIAYQFLTEDSCRTLTYRELEIKAKSLAVAFQTFDCQSERAMLLLPPGLDYVIGFFSCLYAGVIPVPAYPPRRNHHGQRLAAIAENAKAKFVLTQDVFASQCEFASHVITTDNIDAHAIKKYSPIKKVNELAFLQYTSGSTHLPKGVMISQQNILANLDIIHHYFGSRSEKICSWLPPYHDMGLIGGILYPLYVCQPVILMSPSYFLQSPLRWLDVISQQKVTTSVAPNFAYDLCVKKVTEDHIKKLDLSHWHYALNGSEPIRFETMQKFCQTFAPAGFSPDAIRPVYGLAEATLIVSAAEKRKWNDPLIVTKQALENRSEISTLSSATPETISLISCGSTPSKHLIQIVDPKTLQSVKDGMVGEICVSGPSIATGYWDNTELTKQILKVSLSNYSCEFLRTGDLGFLYQDELFITGRVKDLIIIHGLNHYPQDIEQTVMESHPALQLHGTAAFTIEENNEEQLVVMQEVGRQYVNKLDENEIFNAILSAVLVKHGISIKSIILLKPHRLPKTSSGKIQRWACKQLFISDEDSFIAKWMKPETKATEFSILSSKYSSLFQWLMNWLTQRSLITSHIKLTDTLAQYGFDSLIAAELAADLQNYLGKFIDPAAILEQKTAHDLLHYLTKSELINIRCSQATQKIPLVKPITHPLSEAAKDIYFAETEGISAATTIIDHKTYINFAGYNYLGMSGDPIVTDAVIQAVKEYGSSVSASRIASGQKKLHSLLENSLANLIGVEDCIVYSSGHATNVSIISHLFGADDLILHDALCHNSILQGAIFSGATRMAFPHNDYSTLVHQLEKFRAHYQKVLIVSEGIFSMDGDIPNVPRLIEIKNNFDAFLMLDEAHSIGVLGKTGAGVREYFDVNPNDVDIWMGTLSKAFASCGGYIAGSQELIDHLKYHAAAFVYSAGISPANTAAALASLQLMRQEPQRLETLRHNHTLLLNLLKKENVETGKSDNTPIIPIITGDEKSALDLSLMLKAHGIFAIPIFYPAVEKGRARVRLFVNCLHTEEHINFAVEKIVKGLKANSNKTSVLLGSDKISNFI